MSTHFVVLPVVLHRALLAGVAVSATVVLSACGGDTSPSGSGMGQGPGMMSPGAPASAAAGTSTFTNADVMFARMMIPHHQQAIEMADLAATRAADPEVKALASTIKAAQQPEIDTMTGWLSGASGMPMPNMSRGMPLPGSSGMPLPGMGDGGMPGSMSQADMSKLTAAKGTAFDKQFLTMMIAHHQGAITMAQQESAAGGNADAKALAAKIVTDQQAQITTMQTILARL